ncbi:2-polyprenyl-6-methoxyphenol hydroxylase-like FAD-dependent oxidoreductase [Spinactinospora alkalitolerans]|uniref:2-polyprenyl-6-methoxyphenol hydroxylase-like FAD-dependent oxidoreductase n=1 Tax=Spinactinospora alkalitolerans TaxID=687207 RepID=A0A852U0Z6_9ACTN|nr:hypothetical protein [Spinactinospora alkalitolerans]NYE49205.1 2-polyprenyl-6-methoxyphenol hydroxylase-like FAD-dependent oxidoreductase [Spinactinospora alkalitolerans]
MRIVVVGAGVGGLALARGLGAHGHEVSVHERSGELRRGGAAVTLYPNGSAASGLEAIQQYPVPPMPRGLADRLATGQFISYVRSVSTASAAERAGVGLS